MSISSLGYSALFLQIQSTGVVSLEIIKPNIDVETNKFHFAAAASAGFRRWILIEYRRKYLGLFHHIPRSAYLMDLHPIAVIPGHLSFYIILFSQLLCIGYF
jgi:hypothetical protein